MRRAARVDETQAEIVVALRACGCLVLSLAGLGQGVPDLLCCFRGRLFLVECKTGTKSPSRRRLTEDQAVFHALWPVTVIESVDGVLNALRALRFFHPEAV